MKFISHTSETFDFGIKSLKSDVFTYLENTQKSFDIVFADPPYDMPQEQFEGLVSSIFANNIISNEGLCIIEHSKHTSLSHVEGFDKLKRYGGNCFSFFK